MVINILKYIAKLSYFGVPFMIGVAIVCIGMFLNNPEKAIMLCGRIILCLVGILISSVTLMEFYDTVRQSKREKK